MNKNKGILISLFVTILLCNACTKNKSIEGIVLHPQTVINKLIDFDNPNNSALINDNIYANESYIDLIEKRAPETNKCFVETNDGDVVCIMFKSNDIKEIEENHIGKYEIIDDLGRIYYNLHYAVVYKGKFGTGHDSEMTSVAVPTYLVREVDIN